MLKTILKRQKTNQLGDTIVEVLISIAIGGFVLGITYFAINEQSHQIENQKEIAQATQLVDNQIEDIKNYTGSDSLSSVVCFDYLPDPSNPANSTISDVTAAGGPEGTNKCILQNNGSPANAGQEPAYNLSMQPPIVQGSSTTYKVVASWVNDRGTNNTVSMEYRNQ
jgi:type II secretory pathway pseudopilin PulG